MNTLSIHLKSNQVNSYFIFHILVYKSMTSWQEGNDCTLWVAKFDLVMCVNYDYCWTFNEPLEHENICWSDKYLKKQEVYRKETFMISWQVSWSHVYELSSQFKEIHALICKPTRDCDDKCSLDVEEISLFYCLQASVVACAPNRW